MPRLNLREECMSRACIGVSTLAAQGSSNVSTTARNLQKEARVFFLQARTSARVYTPKLDLRVGARKPYYAVEFLISNFRLVKQASE